MANFYIEKLVLSGPSKENAVANFKEGLNFIIAPSNTGKTTIINSIDYLFGFIPKNDSPFIFDETRGYDYFSLTLKTEKGTVILGRKLGESKVTVSGTDNTFEHGTYSLSKTSKKQPPLNRLWLSLMGIDDTHNILRTIKGDKQQITVRGMLHMFLLKQLDISRPSSVLLNSKTFFNDTASKSILLLLMSGIDADKKETPERQKVRKAKRLAVIEYIKDSVGKLAQKEGDLLRRIGENEFDLDEALAIVKVEITSLQNQMNDSVSKSKHLMGEIFKHNSKLVECETLSNRFAVLRGQYNSDVERLSFIVEGNINQDNLPPNDNCPFCDGKISVKDTASYAQVAHAELSHIRVHLTELSKAENDVNSERNSIQKIVIRLENEKKAVDSLIANDLTPQLNSLNTKLRDYRKAIELSKELAFIQEEEKRLSQEATLMEKAKDTPDEKYDVIQHFDDELLLAFNERLKDALEICNYEGFASARLSLRDGFDIEAAGKSKVMLAGGGYLGFLNTILALTLIQFLEEKGTYSPGILIADSPLSQLSEPENKDSLETKKAGFFNYLMAQANKPTIKGFKPQIIIAEHHEKLPFPIESSENVNVIRFTQIEGDGRYEFFGGDVADEI